MDKHWYVAYDVFGDGEEILFTGGEFSEVETREEAIQIVHDKFGQFGAIRIREVEHLENPYSRKKRGGNKPTLES